MAKETNVTQLNLKIPEGKFTSYEKARMIGSRALQISQGAAPLVKLTKKDLESLHYNPIEIAKKEFDEGKIPLSVRRTSPQVDKSSDE